MQNGIRKRNVFISGRKTSVSVEDEFWRGLKEIAFARNTKLGIIVSAIDSGRQHANLSSAIRLFVLNFYQTRARTHGTDGYRSVNGNPECPPYSESEGVAAPQNDATDQKSTS
jgi:predicted DNA-binding ribbon-helix-helix protein